MQFDLNLATRYLLGCVVFPVKAYPGCQVSTLGSTVCSSTPCTRQLPQTAGVCNDTLFWTVSHEVYIRILRTDGSIWNWTLIDCLIVAVSS